MPSFADKVSRLLVDETLRYFADVTFIVPASDPSDAPPDDATFAKFPAHRNIISIQSPVFAKAFNINMPWKETTSKEIFIADTTAEAFDIFLRYVYSDSIDWRAASLDHIVLAAELAERYQVESMIYLIENELSEHLTVDDALRCFVCAMSDGPIAKACVNFLAKKWSDVILSEAFLDLQWKDIYDLILALKEHDSVAEVDKLKIVRSWIDANGTPSPLRDNSRLLECLIDVRKMSIEDVECHVEPSKLFGSDILMTFYKSHALKLSRSDESMRKVRLCWEGGDCYGGAFQTLDSMAKHTRSGRWDTLLTTTSFKSGRHAWTVRLINKCDMVIVGVSSSHADRTVALGQDLHGCGLFSQGQKFRYYRWVKYGDIFDSSAVDVRVFLDMNQRSVAFALKNPGEKEYTNFGVAFTSLPESVHPAVSFSENGTIAQIIDYANDW
mmetsp:Transcript_14536/g.24141  ORF Transcript_14536/g.24141 Transcript_14536/m.24141 type:complete len:441 (-) Transcript_14536:1186-2508(-)